MKKGAFFGASVTAQSKGNGYCDVLKRILLNECEIIQRGFGACHFDDAGFFYASEVANEAPDFMVLEWNTTGLNKFDPEKFSYVVDELYSQRVSFGFLILPRLDKNIAKDRECERQVIEYCNSNAVPLLDLRGKVRVEDCLRDMFHTNKDGAERYGELIAAWVRECFLAERKSRSGQGERKFDAEMHELIRPARQKALEKKRVDRSLTLVGECTSSAVMDVVASVTVGPQSPVIEISVHGADHFQSKISLFDAWCDYQRVMTIPLWPRGIVLPVGGRFVLNIAVTNERPDYSVCKKADFNYDGPMFIDVHSLHTSGMNVDFKGCR